MSKQHPVLKYLIVSGLWATLLVPFYVASNMYFPFISGKNFAFRIIVEVVFALWVYLACVEPKYRPKWSWLAKAIALFVVVMAVADFFAVNPAKAFWSNYERMDGWVTLIHMLMYFLVLSSMLKTEKIWLWLFRTNVATSVIIAFIDIRGWLAGGSGDTAGPFGNIIYVAIYLLFSFFFALILFYKDVVKRSAGTLGSILKKWATYAYLAVMIIFVWGIWATGTRGVILGLLGGLLVTMALVLFFEKEQKLVRRFSIGILVAIAIVVGGFFAFKNTQFVQKNPVLHSFAVLSWSSIQGQGQARQLIWPLAIKGFLEKPVLGWGQEGFNYVFNKYYTPNLYGQEQWFDRAHSEPLDVLVAGGALGEIAYLLIYLAALVIIWKRRTSLGITDAALLVGTLAAYFAQSVFVFDNLTSYMCFYIVLAYIASRDAESADSRSPAAAPKAGVQPDVANYVVAPILLVVLGVVIWFANVKPIEANLDLIKAMQPQQAGLSANLQYFKDAFALNTFGSPEAREQLLTLTPQIVGMQNIDTATKQDFVDLAYQEAQNQVAETPQDSRYYLFAGTFLDNINEYQLALPYLQKAVALSPAKQTTMFELVKCYEYLGESDQALALAKQAYEEDTSFADAKTYYVAALDLAGQSLTAMQLFGFSTTSSDMVVRAYLIKASNDVGKGNTAAAVADVRTAVTFVPGFAAQAESVIKSIEAGKAQ